MCRWWRRRRRGRGIALIIPFSTRDERRTRTFHWLKEYWEAFLPGADIVTGTDDHVPFSKTSAFNDAVGRVPRRDDIFVLLDADGYLDWGVLLDCAREIRKARKRSLPLWFIPYRHFIRLTDLASQRVLASDPAHPLQFSVPPAPQDCLPTWGESQGHWWGALVQVMPREAYEAVGGMDWRFRGWGGEDVAFMRAVDTLYGRHKTTANQVLHLWHAFASAPELTVKGDPNVLRLWGGQSSGVSNDQLANRYYAAFGDPQRMRRLVNEYQVLGAQEAADDAEEAASVQWPPTHRKP